MCLVLSSSLYTYWQVTIYDPSLAPLSIGAALVGFLTFWHILKHVSTSTPNRLQYMVCFFFFGCMNTAGILVYWNKRITKCGSKMKSALLSSSRFIWFQICFFSKRKRNQLFFPQEPWFIALQMKRQNSKAITWAFTQRTLTISSHPLRTCPIRFAAFSM